ncbi:reverse transcriptase domain-containing protein [Tanacetum coccineum]|uniref:Reverse transcriptase domain-containing protein n=1 Tax=Tanacetum coccineum TaxID=301880 RepID=A0ABQ4XN77_9ASTR
MKLNPKKCSFDVEEGPFLGHLITKQGIQANPSKVKAITDVEQLKTLKDVHSLNRKIATLNRFLSKGAEDPSPSSKNTANAYGTNTRRGSDNVPHNFDRKHKCSFIRKKERRTGSHLLREHDIVFQKRGDETPKDFLIEVPLEDNRKEAEGKANTKSKKTELSCEWKLYTNGAVSLDGSGVWLMLIDPEEVLVEVLSKWSIKEKEILQVETKEGESWMTPIHEYLNDDIVKEVHEGSCGFNAEPRPIVVRITKQGYYWPSMHQDVAKVIQDCEKCKEQSAKRKTAKSSAITAGSG